MKEIKINKLKISFKDTKVLLNKLRFNSLLQNLAFLSSVKLSRKQPNNIEYSKSLEKIYSILFTIARKYTKDYPESKLENIYFESLFVTKGPLLSISRFKRARGTTSPKYKNSCNLCIKLNDFKKL